MSIINTEVTQLQKLPAKKQVHTTAKIFQFEYFALHGIFHLADNIIMYTNSRKIQP